MKTVFALLFVVGLLVGLGVLLSPTPISSEFPRNINILPSSETPVATSSIKTDETSQHTPQVFVVSIGEEFSFPQGRATLEYLIGDSRCPVLAQCVWAGEVQVAFKYVNKKTSQERYTTLTYPGVKPVEFDGNGIEIIAVEPEKTSQPVDKNAYRFHVRVNHVDESADPASNNSLGELVGTVLIGPMCPVVREGVDCPDKAAPDVFLNITNVASGASSVVKTDEAGAFHTFLASGEYVIENASVKPYPSIIPINATILSGEKTTIIVHGDSGIR